MIADAISCALLLIGVAIVVFRSNHHWAYLRETWAELRRPLP